MPDSVLRQALAHLEAAAELSPRNARYRAVLGEALLAAGDDAAAERHLGAASNLGSSARVEALWAWALLRSGRVAQAAAVVEESLRRQGDYSHGLYVAGLAAACEGDVPAAIALLRRASQTVDDAGFYLDEAARLRDRGVEGALGLARPAAKSTLRRLLRGAADLRRSTGEIPTC